MLVRANFPANLQVLVSLIDTARASPVLLASPPARLEQCERFGACRGCYALGPSPGNVV